MDHLEFQSMLPLHQKECCLLYWPSGHERSIIKNDIFGAINFLTAEAIHLRAVPMYLPNVDDFVRGEYYSVTSKKSLNVYKTCPKIISLAI